MDYKVRSFNPADASVTEQIVQAERLDEVHALVEREHLTLLSVHPVAATRGGGPASFNVGLFCQELRTLLGSGMTAVEALEALAAKSRGEPAAVLSGLRLRLLEGKSLSAALELSQFAFPRLLVASIRASERSSRVEDALDEYVHYDRLTAEIKRKLISAAIYPAVVIGFGTLVCLFMLTYVVPRFAQVYDDFGHALSLPTRVLLAIARASRDDAAYFLCGGIAAACGGVLWYRSGAMRRTLLRLASHFAILRHQLRLFQLAQIYQTLSMLLRGGYTLADALPLARHLAFGAEIAAGIDAATRAVVEGKRVSAAFGTHGLTDHVTERLLQVGERSGNLAKVMDIIAAGYRQEFTLFVERATRLLEPALLMAMGLLIGTIIILLYAPVFELAGAM
jgi:general secretion pathway protein F